MSDPKASLPANPRSSGSGDAEDAVLTDDPSTIQDARLQDMSFRFPLRRYQQDIFDLLERKLHEGERELHIVAPPGAGKTIIGLQIISRFKCASLILSPNTTIQSQWGQKLDLFLPPGMESLASADILGTHEDKPLKPITSLTYQVLSTPEREQDYFNKLAHQSWVNELNNGRSLTVGEAEIRILEILHNNPKAYKKEISRHVSRLRKQLSEVLDLKEVLHKNALELLQSMRRQRFGLVIFDECHHLTDYWAAIMTHLVKTLGNPIVVGLTGTPPEGKSASQERRYLSLVGEIDYQVPTPALVREGGLAPFQDLVYFTAPTDQEFQFLAEQHQEFHAIVEELTSKPIAGEARGPEHRKEVGARNDAVRDRQAENEEGASEKRRAAPGLGMIGDFGPETCLSSSEASRLDGPQCIDLIQDGHGGTIALVGNDWECDSSLDPDLAAEATEPVRAEQQRLAIPNRFRLAAESDQVVDLIDSGLDVAAEYQPILTAWVEERIAQIRSTTPDEPQRGWRQFSQENADLAAAMSRYTTLAQDRESGAQPANTGDSRADQPRHAPGVAKDKPSLSLEDWMLLLEDFASHKLKLSANPKHHLLYKRIQSAARKLGFAITEQGLRRQASPVDRVLAFSNSKPHAVSKILETEFRSLEDRLRAAIVTDFERMSATSSRAVSEVLSDESGGALAVLRVLLEKPIGAFVNPCLVTGSLLLVDRSIGEKFMEAAKTFLLEAGHKFDLIAKEEENLPYIEVTAASTQWQSRLYVGMATAIFERGITKCLIGTRGLFGEGWDSQALNTLIDLTNTTSPVSVKQLRGRSIRIQTDDPLGARKVANNWDVVCIAPSLEKGLNDYLRFMRKHDGYFGICEDGQIEAGVGHVHSSLASLSGTEVFASSDHFNEEMTNRALVRDRIYDLWKVGQPYNNSMLGCVELTRLRKLALTPPHLRRNIRLKDHARQLRASLNGVWLEHALFGSAGSAAAFALTASLGLAANFTWIIGLAPILLTLHFAKQRYVKLFTRFQKEICQPNSQQSSLTDIAYAVLTALQGMKILPGSVSKQQIFVTVRPDKSYRVMLKDVASEHSKIFTNSLGEVLAPLVSQPYVIPKYEYFIDGENESAVLKEQKFFRSYLRGRAEPRVACYHAVPSLLARSQKGRQMFEACWNKYISPGFVLSTEKDPRILDRYFGLGPSLAQRLLWE